MGDWDERDSQQDGDECDEKSGFHGCEFLDAGIEISWQTEHCCKACFLMPRDRFGHRREENGISRHVLLRAQ
jgi:hypothetical protein